MRKLTIAAMLMLAAVYCGAQDFSSILSEIERNNITLKSLRSKAEADKLEYRTGLTPDDPEVEMGYLWETKDPEGGHRIDLGVSQSFDFPTVYYWKKKISDGQCTAAEIEYAIGRKNVLLEARQTCIELVFNNAVCAILAESKDNSERVFKGMEQRYAHGDIGIVSLNEARLSMMNASRAYRHAEIERQATLDALKLLNGGKSVSFEYDSFPMMIIPEDFEQWYSDACLSNSEIGLLSKNLELAESSVRLAQSEWLPKFTIGYTSERVPGSTLQGISGGISIPLWSGKGKVKAAKARQQASADILEADRTSFMNSMKSKHDRLKSLYELCEEYRTLLEDTESAELLLKALEEGEINFGQYATSMQSWYSSQMELLESERDCHVLLSELEAFKQ